MKRIALIYCFLAYALLLRIAPPVPAQNSPNPDWENPLVFGIHKLPPRFAAIGVAESNAV
jgi:hypothetical protein